MAATRTLTGKPVYRMFPVEVARVHRLGPSFVRLTFRSECLREFGAGGDDQRIKLVLPQPGRTLDDFPAGPDWYQQWLALPDHVRPHLRTYTVRAYRPESAELDVDFVLHSSPDHGHGGPASSWASAARPGDVIGLLGPDRPGTGRMWGCEWSPPATAENLVLAGDETAVPAVAAIVEALPADARGVVCLEVPEEHDRQEWNAPEGVAIRWLPRCARTEHGELLTEAIAEAMKELHPQPHSGASALDDIDVDTTQLWEVPAAPQTGGLYGWLAGEASVIKRLRRMLVSDYGVPKQSVAFMGYWRQGHC